MDYSRFYKYIASYSQAVKGVRPVLGFVTISRQAGAGGTTVADHLADYLNEQTLPLCPWTVFDKNIVHEVVKDHHFPERIVPFLKEASIAEIQDTLEDLMKLHPAHFTLVQRTNETILRLANMGHAILVGRGANILTKQIPGGVHVRLIGTSENRKRHQMKKLNCSEKDAQQFINDEDAGRTQYLKKYFDQDIDNPLLYDAVINTDQVSYRDAAVIIAELFLRRLKRISKTI